MIVSHPRSVNSHNKTLHCQFHIISHDLKANNLTRGPFSLWNWANYLNDIEFLSKASQNKHRNTPYQENKGPCMNCQEWSYRFEATVRAGKSIQIYLWFQGFLTMTWLGPHQDFFFFYNSRAMHRCTRCDTHHLFGFLFYSIRLLHISSIFHAIVQIRMKRRKSYFECCSDNQEQKKWRNRHYMLALSLLFEILFRFSNFLSYIFFSDINEVWKMDILFSQQSNLAGGVFDSFIYMSGHKNPL